MTDTVFGIGNEDDDPMSSITSALIYDPEFHLPGGAAVEGFDVGDIAELTHHLGRWPGGWDGDFAGVGRLKDGRWFGWEGWHDSTGWDCQSGATFVITDSQEDAFRWGLSKETRKAFGVVEGREE